MSRPQPGRRGDYVRFEPVPMRWADADIYGHMNNAVHYYLFDTAVQAVLVREGVLDLGASETVFLVVSSGCDYFGEVVFGDRVEAGLRVARLGASSVRYEIGIFRNGADRASAEGYFVHVNVGREDRRPRPLSAKAREVMQRLCLSGKGG
ncbi:MAG: thioesterase family protein [Rhodobacter sp.]|nr:thioesterase family protein [Rhodobacter sp.]